MSLDTYDGLKAEVADWLNKTNLTARIPSFIALAEAQMRREIKARPSEETLDFTIDSDSFPVPCGFDGVLSLSVRCGYGRALTYLSPDLFDARNWRGTEWCGDALEAGVLVWADCYTISGDMFYFNAVPGEVRLRYRALFTALSATTRCNWLLKKHPDAYLYGALMQAAPYLEDDGRISVWGGLFTSAINSINQQAISQQHGPVRVQAGSVV